MKTVHDISVKTLDGQSRTLAEYRGKVLLIVNVASYCGFTPQYQGLQSLHEKYLNRGLCILAFPCNDFLAQEPGSPDEIREFCEREYGVGFEIFEKVRIRGGGCHALFEALQGSRLAARSPGGIRQKFFKIFKTFLFWWWEGRALECGRVQWNFHKFLVDKKGLPVAHFASDCEPLNPDLVACIESELVP